MNFVKRGIDDYFGKESSDISRKVRIFSTGEPTTRMDVVKGIAAYVDDKWAPTNLSIQTNGYFSLDTARWIADHCNEILVSCDGPPIFQDQQRPIKDGRPSSPIVERNIRFFASKPLDFKVRATITDLSVDHQADIIDYFYRLGVRHILVDHLFGEGTERRGVSKPDYLEYARKFVSAYEYAHELGVIYWCSFMANIGRKVKHHCKACEPSPHLIPDGHVTACDLVYSARQPGVDQLIYGFYDAEEDMIRYEPEKVLHLRARTVNNLPSECRKCGALYHCAGGCPGEAALETGDIYGIRPHACEAVRFIVNYFRER